MIDGADISDKYKDTTFAANLAIVRYVDGEPWFFFVRDGFTSTKF